MSTDGSIGNGWISPPVRLYDLFGYLMPAGAFAGSVSFFEYVLAWHYGQSSEVLLLSALWLTIESGLRSGAWAIEFVVLAFCVIGLYGVGHGIASISSLALDRMLVFKCLGYPFERILKTKYRYGGSDGYSGTSLHRNLFRGGFFFLNLVVLLCAVIVVGGPWDGQWLAYAVWAALATVVVGVTVGAVVPEAEAWRARKHENDGSTAKFRFGGLVGAVFGRLPERWLDKHSLAWFASPFLRVAQRAERVLRLMPDVPPKQRAEFFDFLERDIGVTRGEVTSDVFWYSSHYIATRSPQGQRMMLNWLHQYGFARNLATALYLASLAMIWHMWSLSLQGPVSGSNAHVAVFCITYLGAWMMLLRYLYLYYGYYSRYIFRVFLYERRHQGPPASAPDGV